MTKMLDERELKGYPSRQWKSAQSGLVPWYQPEHHHNEAEAGQAILAHEAKHGPCKAIARRSLRRAMTGKDEPLTHLQERILVSLDEYGPATVAVLANRFRVQSARVLKAMKDLEGRNQVFVEKRKHHKTARHYWHLVQAAS